MTLLELLVKELPQRGGWPEGVSAITQGSDGMLEDFREDDDGHVQIENLSSPLTLSDNYRLFANTPAECGCEIVYLRQYEAAIAKAMEE